MEMYYNSFAKKDKHGIYLFIDYTRVPVTVCALCMCGHWPTLIAHLFWVSAAHRKRIE